MRRAVAAPGAGEERQGEEDREEENGAEDGVVVQRLLAAQSTGAEVAGEADVEEVLHSGHEADLVAQQAVVLRLEFV